MKLTKSRLEQIIKEELDEGRSHLPGWARRTLNRKDKRESEEENEATLALGLLSKLRVEMGNQNEIGIVAGGTFQLLQDLLKQIERSLNHLRNNP